MVRKRGGPPQLTRKSRTSDNIGLRLSNLVDNKLRYFSVQERTSVSLRPSWYWVASSWAWSTRRAVTSPTSRLDKSLFTDSIATDWASQEENDKLSTFPSSWAYIETWTNKGPNLDLFLHKWHGRFLLPAWHSFPYKTFYSRCDGKHETGDILKVIYIYIRIYI